MEFCHNQHPSFDLWPFNWILMAINHGTRIWSFTDKKCGVLPQPTPIISASRWKRISLVAPSGLPRRFEMKHIWNTPGIPWLKINELWFKGKPKTGKSLSTSKLIGIWLGFPASFPSISSISWPAAAHFHSNSSLCARLRSTTTLVETDPTYGSRRSSPNFTLPKQKEGPIC